MMKLLDFNKIWDGHSDKIALIDNDNQVRYRLLRLKLIGKLNELHQTNIKSGDRVALLGPGSLSFIINLLALLHLDVIAVPLSSRLTETQIQDRLKQSGCTKIIAEKSFSKYTFPSSVHLIEMTDSIGSRIDTQLRPLPLTQPATILFTSGSTGEPKAILHTVGNHYFSALGSAQNIPLNPGDRWLISLPLYHVGGMSIIFRTLLAGATLVIPRDKLSVGQNLRHASVTHVSLVPTQLISLLEENADIPILKAVLLGGGSISNETIARALHTGLPLYLSYGSTEMASQITATAAGDIKQRSVTCGHVLKYRTVQIATDGEVLVKGMTLSPGYVEKDQIYPLADEDSWYHTGDIGSLDSQGRLMIFGRKDNMFISGGENIQPEEIESTLCSHPDILNAVVVEIPDVKFGFRPVAFLDLKPGAQLHEKNIHRFLSDKIERFKIPLYFFPWPESGDEFKTNRDRFRKIAAQKVDILESGE